MPSITCPHCDATVRVGRADLGRKIRCPECDKRFIADEDDEDDDVDGRAARDEPDERRPRRKATSGMKMPSCMTGGCFLAVLLVGCLGLFGFLSGDRDRPAKPNGGTDQAAAEQQRQEAARREQERADRNRDRTAKKDDAGRVKANRNLPRDQFRNLITDKAPEELIQLIGKPNRTQEIEGDTRYYYHNVAVDPASGKKTAVVEITFDSIGRVKEVNFF
jgi:predicted Zn finger-like uncharacterized protein